MPLARLWLQRAWRSISGADHFHPRKCRLWLPVKICINLSQAPINAASAPGVKKINIMMYNLHCTFTTIRGQYCLKLNDLTWCKFSGLGGKAVPKHKSYNLKILQIFCHCPDVKLNSLLFRCLWSHFLIQTAMQSNEKYSSCWNMINVSFGWHHLELRIKWTLCNGL